MNEMIGKQSDKTVHNPFSEQHSGLRLHRVQPFDRPPVDGPVGNVSTTMHHIHHIMECEPNQGASTVLHKVAP